jgi:hypothetical protein
MPGVDRQCVTHHDACDCREAARREKEQQLQARVAQLEASVKRVHHLASSKGPKPVAWALEEVYNVADATLSAPPSPLVEVARAAMTRIEECECDDCTGCEQAELCNAVDDLKAAQPGVWGGKANETIDS